MGQRGGSTVLAYYLILIFLNALNVNCASSNNDIFKEANRFKRRSLFQRIFGGTFVDNIAEYEAGSRNGDESLNITEIIEKYGYSVETHHVETDDGYGLTIFRIPSNGTAVLLEHGLATSCNCWIVSGQNISLVYLLADHGYDVWLGNARGTDYGLKHVNLTTNDSAFWNFTWDEIGRYDVPATIDYALKVNGKKKLIYIGHSQGATAFLVMASERPEYNDKVSHATLMGPAAWISNSASPILQKPIVSFEETIITPIFGSNLENNGSFTRRLKTFICNGSLIQNLYCYEELSLLCGFDNEQINYKSLSLYVSHSPSGFATKQVVHYLQSVLSGKFRQFDYEDKNMEVYGSESPPDYPVDKITVPIAIFFAENDWINTRKDVQILLDHLKTNVTFRTIPYKNFNHIDFLIAKDVRILLYNDILDIMNQYRTD